MENYEIDKLIGKGSYGTVYQGRRKKDGTKCVLKKIPLTGLTNEERIEAFNEVHHTNPYNISLN